MDQKVVEKILKDFENMENGKEFTISELMRKYKVDEKDFFSYYNKIIDRIKSQVKFDYANQFVGLPYNLTMQKIGKVDKKSIIKLEYKSVTQIADGSYYLKVEFLENGLKIKVKGCWYELNIQTKYNKNFILSIINALDDLHLEDWNKSYDVTDKGIYITDLPTWEIKITYSTNDIKKIEGYGAYPENWKDFEKIIDKLLPLSTIESFRD